jgi:DNA polymerase sigma
MKEFPFARVVMFGSAASFLAVPGSDIDIVVLDSSVDFKTLFNRSYDVLSRIGRFQEVEKIICNVPIVKLRDKKTGIYADIAFNRDEAYKSVITVLAC